MSKSIAANHLEEEKFISQEDYEAHRANEMKGPRGWPLFYATQSGVARAQVVAEIYNSVIRQRENDGADKNIEMIHSTDKTPSYNFCHRDNLPATVNHISSL